MVSKASGKSNETGNSGKNARGPQRRFKWLRLGLLNVVFLIAPFGAWYFMQVQDTLETNTIRTFRALNEIDTALVDIINNLPKIWEFSVRVGPYRQALCD
jgi:cytoskeletal protein RodZ